MKTAEELKIHLNKCLDSLLTRPKMWADTPLGVETQFLFMIHLCLFIDDDPNDRRMTPSWHKWGYKQLGVEGNALPVASYLVNENKIDDDWKILTDMLSKFRSDKIWIWSAKKFIEENEHLFSKEKT